MTEQRGFWLGKGGLTDQGFRRRARRPGLYLATAVLAALAWAAGVVGLLLAPPA